MHRSTAASVLLETVARGSISAAAAHLGMSRAMAPRYACCKRGLKPMQRRARFNFVGLNVKNDVCLGKGLEAVDVFHKLAQSSCAVRHSEEIDSIDEWLPDMDYAITLATISRVGKKIFHRDVVAIAKKTDMVNYLKALDAADDLRPFYIWPASGDLSFVIAITDDFQVFEYR